MHADLPCRRLRQPAFVDAGPTRNRIWPIYAVTAILALFALLQLPSLARADHYHTFNNITHGLVHGSSDTDGAFFSRTYGYYSNSINYCSVGDYDVGYYATAYSFNANLCSLFSFTEFPAPDECRGVSGNLVTRSGGGSDYLGSHVHSAHSPPQFQCRVGV